MDETNNSYILEMRDIVKVFPGVKALNNAQLKLKKGEIHALVGENGAGKSTLMNVLLGIYERDGGEIIYQGEQVNFKAPAQALNSGISMIHQEISMMPNLTIAENVWIAREDQYRRGIFLNKKAMNEKTRELYRDFLEMDINPKTRAETLSIAQLQMVELVRAASYNAKIIIMDEPTSALTSSEVEMLFKVVRKLAAQGVTVVFITHKLEEIFQICQRITVMRDGCFIKTCGTDEITIPQLIELIAGRKLENLYPKEPTLIGEEVLHVEHLNRISEFEDISFSVRKGEVLGFCGLIGAGRTEIMQAIYGLTKLDSGSIFLNGKPINISSPEVAIKNGISFVTEDRLRQGVIARLPVNFNMTITNLFRYVKGIFVDKKQERADCDAMIEEMKVKTSNKKQLIAQLSGGNQQKVIIGRCLLTKPQLFIMDEPTRGIDVGSKSEIYKIINDLTQKGMAVLMISSETPELLGVCDRIAVISGGKLVGIYDAKTTTQTELMTAAFSNV